MADFNDLRPEPVRFSQLKHMAKSPAHYRYELTAPEPARKKPYYGKGTALHSYLVGDEDAVVVYRDGIRNGKRWDEFSAAHSGKTILIPSEATDVIGMREAVKAHPDARSLLDGTRETRMNWSIAGRSCRGTPDVRTGMRVVELKTCRSSHPERFVWDGKRLGYNGALAWYIDGAKLAGVGEPIEAWVVAVESSPPYPVTIFRMTEAALEAGRKCYRLWFERLRACEDADYWPGYVESVVDFDVAGELELTFADDD